MGEKLPCDFALLTSFRGVGPSVPTSYWASLAAYTSISVDVHVHRVTNRWGYVATRTPEQTMAALAQVLPQRYWVEINRLLVPFGKHICTGSRPHCSTCPLLEMCCRCALPKLPSVRFKGVWVLEVNAY